MRDILRWCSVLTVVLLTPLAATQSRATDFSGGWLLTTLRPEPDEPDTLEIAAAEELFITQTMRFIAVERVSKSGNHPADGTFDFGVRGRMEGIPNGLQDAEITRGVGFFGTQLIISETRQEPPDADGIRLSSGHGSIWRLDQEGRLVIEFREHRSHERPRIAIRIYRRK